MQSSACRRSPIFSDFNPAAASDFQQSCGMAPKQYISSRKIEKAKQILCTISISVTDLAALLGYDSAYHFSAAFKKLVGCPPSVFRKQCAKAAPPHEADQIDKIEVKGSEYGKHRFYLSNEYQKEISFPLGGIGSGCVGLSGDGRLIDWELHSRPNKQSVNGFTHFAIKAQQGNHVLGARVLQSDTRKDFMGSNRQAAHSWGYGHGIDRNTMAGFVHFRNVTFHGNFPVAEVEYGDPDFPARMRLTAFNPFIPSNVFDSSLPAAFLNGKFKTPLHRKLPTPLRFLAETHF